MNNFILFVCGLVVALISGMGVVVYMVSVGYEEKKARTPEIDADLGAIEKTIAKRVDEIQESSAPEIPSVS